MRWAAGQLHAQQGSFGVAHADCLYSLCPSPAHALNHTASHPQLCPPCRAAPPAPSPHRSPPASAGGASPAGSQWSYEGIVRSLAAPPRRMLEAFTQRFSPQLQSVLGGSAGSGSFRQAAGGPGLLSSSPQPSVGVHDSPFAPSGEGQQEQPQAASGGGGDAGAADVEKQ